MKNTIKNIILIAACALMTFVVAYGVSGVDLIENLIDGYSTIWETVSTLCVLVPMVYGAYSIDMKLYNYLKKSNRSTTLIVHSSKETEAA